MLEHGSAHEMMTSSDLAAVADIVATAAVAAGVSEGVFVAGAFSGYLLNFGIRHCALPPTPRLRVFRLLFFCLLTSDSL